MLNSIKQLRRSLGSSVVLPCLLVTLSLFAVSGHGIELSGRISSDIYGYKEAGQTHTRPYLGFRSTLTAWRGQERGQLSFHTYLRWRSDLSSQYDNDPQTSVYETYVRLKNVPKGSILSFGRQFVYSGLSSRLIDGVRIKYQHGRRFEFTLYGGAGVSRLNPEKNYGLNERGSFGGRFTYSLPQALRVGLAWMLDKTDGELTGHRIGLDAEKRFSDVNLFTRAVFDVPARRLGDIMARASYRPGQWRVTAEYAWRYPSVASNTLFSLIDYDRRSEIRLNLSRTIGRGLTLVTRSMGRFAGDDKVWSGSVGVRTANYHIAYRFQASDAGDQSGLTGFLRWPYREYLEAYASVDLSRYRVQAEQVDLSDAHSASLGVRWQNDTGLRVGLEGQYLRNAAVTSDYRILLRVSKNFALGGGKGLRW